MKLWIQEVWGWPRPLYTGDRYMQVNLTVNIRDDFGEVVQWPLYTGWSLYTGPLYTGSTVIQNPSKLIRTDTVTFSTQVKTALITHE